MLAKMPSLYDIPSALGIPGADAIDGMRKLLATVFPYGGCGITTSRIKGLGTEPLNCSWGLNPSGLNAANTDTALFDPSSEARIAGTSSQTTTATGVPNDTYQVVGTLTASAPRAITEFGLFDISVSAPQTLLTAAITSGQTTMAVLASGTFPSSGIYYCQIDSEVVAVVSGQGTLNLTIQRGARGSSSSGHVSGAIVVGGESTVGGNMFLKSSFTAVNLASGDSISFTSGAQFLP